MRGSRRQEESALDVLMDMQLRHSRAGKVENMKKTLEERMNTPKSTRLPSVNQGSVSPNASIGRSRGGSLESMDSTSRLLARPKTAPQRLDADLLADFANMFDASAPRPWTSERTIGKGASSGEHIRLGTMIQAEIDASVAMQVVEETTSASLKDSTKVFSALGGHIPSSFPVKLTVAKEGSREVKYTYVKAKPKRSKWGIVLKGDKYKGGLVIIMDPTSNLEDKIVTVHVQHRLGRILAEEEYQARGTGNTFNLEITTTVAATYDEGSAIRGQTRSFPGWNGRPPIWVPCSDCNIGIEARKPPRSIMRRLSVGEAFRAVDVGKDFELPKAPVNCNMLVFSAASPKAAILLLRSIVEKIQKSTVEHLTVGGGIPAINIAALHGNVDAVTQLLSSGANPNARRDVSSDYTTLCEAVLGGHPVIVRMLLEGGANQSLRDAKGNNPLHLACVANDIECVRALLLSDTNQATVRRSLNAENARRLKPHQVCTGTYVKAVVEATMKGYNLAVRPPRIALMA